MGDGEYPLDDEITDGSPLPSWTPPGAEPAPAASDRDDEGGGWGDMESTDI